MSDETVAVKEQKRLVCGLIMPISQLDNLPASHWDEVREIITRTVEEIPDPQFSARLVSEGDDAGVIHKRIIQNVYTDDIAICDVSGRNANVMFELGMRLAFDKPTVIIKDDQTPRIFDTDVIEYVNYRRDLRYAAMETFRAKLAQKIIATHQLAKADPDKQSFLKSFGTFKVVKLDEASEAPEKAMLTILDQIQRQIQRLANDRTPKFLDFGSVKSTPPSDPDDLERLLKHPKFDAALSFTKEWLDNHSEAKPRQLDRHAGFASELMSRFPGLIRAPGDIKALTWLL